MNNNVEKLNQDIKTLLETIRVDWLDVAHLPLSAADRANIRTNIEHLRNDRAKKIADRFDVGRVVLVSLDVGFYVFRRHQTNLVTELVNSRAQ